MKLLEALTDDLRRPEYRGNPNPWAGHCYVACEVLHWWLPTLKPQFVRHEGQPHWFLREEGTGKVVDPTASQFSTPVPYEQGVGKGFLTREPSRRARIVIERMLPGALS